MLAWTLRRIYRHPSKPDESVDVTTADGWRLALHRYRRAAATPVRRHPALLVPGLGANRVSFDLAADLSLARRLAGRGYEVFVPELRGHGLSEMPKLLRGKKRFGWSFDDYLTKDIAAHLDAVAAATGAKQVHWVGHSMGGILLYAHLASGGSKSVKSGITIGSSLDYSGSKSWFKPIARMQWITGMVPAVPLGWMSLVGAPLAARGRGSVADRFVVHPANVDAKSYRLLQATCFHAVSSPVLKQLATAFVEGGLRTLDGKRAYSDGLRKAKSPVLAIAGDRDMQCPPDAARATLEELGSEEKELKVFAPYGHFDLLMGRAAAREVLPSIDAWLDAHD